MTGSPLAVAITTAWPYSASATVTVLEAPAAEQSTIALRIPGWLDTGAITLTLPGGERREVARGTYARVTRVWHAGDSVTVPLNATLTASEYTGLTTIPGHRRFAVMAGPVLLAAVGAWDEGLDSIVIAGVQTPADPHSWLTPLPGAAGSGRPLSLHYAVRGNPGVRFVPYFEVQEELFEVYPAFPPGRGLG